MNRNRPRNDRDYKSEVKDTLKFKRKDWLLY